MYLYFSAFKYLYMLFREVYCSVSCSVFVKVGVFSVFGYFLFVAFFAVFLRALVDAFSVVNTNTIMILSLALLPFFLIHMPYIFVVLSFYFNFSICCIFLFCCVYLGVIYLYFPFLCIF